MKNPKINIIAKELGRMNIRSKAHLYETSI
jgi:hypothetical protein